MPSSENDPNSLLDNSNSLSADLPTVLMAMNSTFADTQSVRDMDNISTNVHDSINEQIDTEEHVLPILSDFLDSSRDTHEVGDVKQEEGKLLSASNGNTTELEKFVSFCVNKEPFEPLNYVIYELFYTGEVVFESDAYEADAISYRDSLKREIKLKINFYLVVDDEGSSHIECAITSLKLEFYDAKDSHFVFDSDNIFYDGERKAIVYVDRDGASDDEDSRKYTEVVMEFPCDQNWIVTCHQVNEHSSSQLLKLKSIIRVMSLEQFKQEFLGCSRILLLQDPLSQQSFHYRKPEDISTALEKIFKRIANGDLKQEMHKTQGEDLRLAAERRAINQDDFQRELQEQNKNKKVRTEEWIEYVNHYRDRYCILQRSTSMDNLSEDWIASLSNQSVKRSSSEGAFHEVGLANSYKRRFCSSCV